MMKCASLSLLLYVAALSGDWPHGDADIAALDALLGVSSSSHRVCANVARDVTFDALARIKRLVLLPAEVCVLPCVVRRCHHMQARDAEHVGALIVALARVQLLLHANDGVRVIGATTQPSAVLLQLSDRGAHLCAFAYAIAHASAVQSIPLRAPVTRTHWWLVVSARIARLATMSDRESADADEVIGDLSRACALALGADERALTSPSAGGCCSVCMCVMMECVWQSSTRCCG
jgi:hypothetical protein